MLILIFVKDQVKKRGVALIEVEEKLSKFEDMAVMLVPPPKEIIVKYDNGTVVMSAETYRSIKDKVNDVIAILEKIRKEER